MHIGKSFFIRYIKIYLCALFFVELHTSKIDLFFTQCYNSFEFAYSVASVSFNYENYS